MGAQSEIFLTQVGNSRKSEILVGAESYSVGLDLGGLVAISRRWVLCAICGILASLGNESLLETEMGIEAG